MPVSAEQNSTLPACGSDAEVWYNCFGTYAYDDCSKYVGEWRTDKYHGQGAYYYADGTVEEGIWHNRLFLGNHGSDEMISTDVYLGTWTQKQGMCTAVGNASLVRHRKFDYSPMDNGTASFTFKHSISINNGIIVVEMEGSFVNAFRVLSDNKMKMVFAKIKEYDSWVERHDGYGGWTGPIYYRCSD